MAPPLELDFDKNALDGVALGSRLETLDSLGDADEDEFADRDLHRYRSFGLELREVEGRLAEIRLVWADRFGLGFQPFRGSLRRGGSTLRPGPATHESELVAFLGRPAERSTHYDETVLRYFGPPASWDVTFGADGALQEIRILEVPVEPNAPWPVGCAAVALMALLVWVGFQDGCPGYHARRARARMRPGELWTEAFLGAEAAVSRSYLLRASCATRQGGSLMFARVPGRGSPRYTIVDQDGSQSYPDSAAWGAAIAGVLRERPCDSLKIGIDREDAFVTLLDDIGRIRSVSSVE